MGRVLLGLIQKAADFADFVYQRGRMMRAYRANRARHRRVFQNGVRSILVVRLASIGDVARSTGVLGALRQRYPDARIDFLASDPTLPVIAGHAALTAVYSLRDLDRLPEYDWIINLQNLVPPDSFLRGSGLTFPAILERLSSYPGCRFVSGRHLVDGREVTPTNILYCLAEVEEHFITALLPFDRRQYPVTSLPAGAEARAAARAKFSLPVDRPVLALFLGSNSVGCGADEGYRTYSIDYLERLIQRFADRFTIAVIGQSQVRNAAELERYRAILAREPRVVDLVDKTSLAELVALMDQFGVLISCDSSPIHLAMARDVPVVGLFVNDATFRLHPQLQSDRFIALNSTPPCFMYSWRWKFFCSTCRDPATRAHYCHNEVFVFGVDRIPIERVDQAVSRLLHGRRPEPDVAGTALGGQAGSAAQGGN
jgi:ADP-heptose:LPS heptosyltransferase